MWVIIKELLSFIIRITHIMNEMRLCTLRFYTFIILSIRWAVTLLIIDFMLSIICCRVSPAHTINKIRLNIKS